MHSDLDPIRHALSLARERGYAEVVVESGDLKFRAALEPAPKKKTPSVMSPFAGTDAQDSPSELIDVVSPMVGYFRAAEPAVATGDEVTVGQVVGVVASLGDIPYGVEALVAGEIEEILVEPGQPVMYGQTLMRVHL